MPENEAYVSTRIAAVGATRTETSRDGMVLFWGRFVLVVRTWQPADAS
jgi:hypothetical protein